MNRVMVFRYVDGEAPYWEHAGTWDKYQDAEQFALSLPIGSRTVIVPVETIVELAITAALTSDNISLV